ncbi:HvfC/BufC N-terminal domain-containing protein [Beijerinckia mobilis]|uniref:HvfC/BufC N-terminal domain-containing protein n=1 Tax=Beijerinckia mobilis TaxID=231434 RepID=UPI000551C318|nr:DNA-binding domain-containing protein [Beijerinckia mobilis]
MHSYIQSQGIQLQFASALLNTDGSVPRGIVAEAGLSPARRFAIHRTNVVTGLAEALASAFPITANIVGAEFLTGMARLFVVEAPPLSPALLDYGEDFPDFVEQFPQAAELPYLADVMRLELARRKAYHAADATPLKGADLAGYDAESFARSSARLHPSVTILSSDHPIVTLFAMNAGEEPLAPIEEWNAQDALIVRPFLSVHVHLLPPGGAVFLHALVSGATFADAAMLASTETPAFSLTENLAGLVSTGALLAIDHENNSAS